MVRVAAWRAVWSVTPTGGPPEDIVNRLGQDSMSMEDLLSTVNDLRPFKSSEDFCGGLPYYVSGIIAV